MTGYTTPPFVALGNLPAYIKFRLSGTMWCISWGKYKLNRAVRLLHLECEVVIGLHGFLFIEFDTSSSVICHMFRQRGFFWLSCKLSKCLLLKDKV